MKPALVILELGGNDGLRGTPLSSTRANLERIVVELQKSGARVVLAGITLVHPSNSFRMDGYLALLVGQNVPHNKRYEPPPTERGVWRQHCQNLATEARAGMDVTEALKAIRSPGLKWA